jgi:hypothetical protein
VAGLLAQHTQGSFCHPHINTTFETIFACLECLSSSLLELENLGLTWIISGSRVLPPSPTVLHSSAETVVPDWPPKRQHGQASSALRNFATSTLIHFCRFCVQSPINIGGDSNRGGRSRSLGAQSKLQCGCSKAKTAL